MRFFKIIINSNLNFVLIEFFLSYEYNMNTSLRVYENDTLQHKLYSNMNRNQTLR